MLRERRGERKVGKTEKERKGEEKERRVLGGISRGETESSGRYTAKCRGGFISLSVLFIDVLSASLVPTVARALSFLCRCLVYLYIRNGYIARSLSLSVSLSSSSPLPLLSPLPVPFSLSLAPTTAFRQINIVVPGC